MHNNKMKDLKVLFFLLFALLFGFASCEDTVEVGEYDNWQEKNALFIDSIAKVARANEDGKWKMFSENGLDENKQWGNSSYVYCYENQAGNGTIHPAYNDTIEIYYRGRLIPSRSYSEGFVFDSSYDGELEPDFDPTVKMLLNNMVQGFNVAVQHMVAGDAWRIYIPYNLAYRSEEKTGIPAYSALIFDINLVSFNHRGAK